MVNTICSILTTSLIQDECQENEGIILTIELTAPTDIKLSDNLNSQQKDQTLKLMAEFSSLIPGLTSKAYHEVKTGNSAPIRAVPYTIPVHYFEKVRGEIKTMLEIGIIERSKSQWASPLITVLKKDGSIRLCGDYRWLNAVTEAGPYYLPRIEDLLFISPLGKYHFTRMPFGLKNAPSTFQRLMDDLFQDQQEFVAVYIDDLAVYSTDWILHMKQLRRVLSILKEAGLTLRVDKFLIGSSYCNFLGHTVGGGKIQPLQAKIEAIIQYKQPTTKRDIRAWLGISGS